MKSKLSKKAISNSNFNKSKKKSFTKAKKTHKKQQEKNDFDEEVDDDMDMWESDENYDEIEQEENSEHNFNENINSEDEYSEGLEAESEDEEDMSSSAGFVTKAMIKKWEVEITSKRTMVSTINKLQYALAAAVESIKGSEAKEVTGRYTVKGNEIFNGIVRLCLRKMAPAVHKLLHLKDLCDRPPKNKMWKILLKPIKKYLNTLIQLVKSMSEPTVVLIVLKKGIIPMLPLYSEFPPISWLLTKQITVLWCTSDEKIRVYSLIVLLRVMRSFNELRREKTLKMLYISYAKNCHFTSPSTWPLIDFMRMSLVELYGMDQPLAYRHGFIYIRQLALHLRNAMLVQKKERIQLVCSWQFIHCLHFWGELLGKTHPSPVLGPLIYPLTQVAIGTITLLMSPKYFPLRFHVCNMLTDLSSKTEIFIPVLPHLLEILNASRIRTRGKKASLKSFEWNCIIKVSVSQLAESAFGDGAIDRFLDCTLRYLNSQCHSIAFPELVFPLTLQLKSFCKKCKVQDYNRKLKQLLEKIDANSKFIDERRKNVTFAITDEKDIKNFEIETLQSVPPLQAYYQKWKGMKDQLLKQEQEFTDGGHDDFSISAVRKRQREEPEDLEEVQEGDEDDQDLEHVPASKKQKNTDSKSQNAGKKNESPPSQDDGGGDDIEDDYSEDDDENDIVREMQLSDYDESDEDD